MENSTLCVINENCAYKGNPRENCKFPDSAREYPVFEAAIEPTKPSKSRYAVNSFLSNEETNVEEYTRKSREKFKILAIIICCVIWTLAAITITLCMLKMADIV